MIFASKNLQEGSASPPDSKYRPDIDGLRAVAVLSVVLYHLGFPAFGGGFVGVDVFFVISGFLITRLIRDEYSENRTFGFRRFYVRRVRRLVPAHVFVSIVCTLWAAVALAPPHLKSYGGALASALVSCSNIYFWSESGYFDTESAIKPLLHTWSLGVEEQFYLVWPAALVLALRSKRSWMAPTLLFLAGAISLALNQVFADGIVAAAKEHSVVLPAWLATKEFLSDGRSTIFYLLPFRVFELAMGAVLVWLVRLRPRREVFLDACVATGLGLIAVAVLTFEETMVFPSYAALVPCTGAALCIYAGQARRSGLILRNPVAVWIGLMSYSLYLVHWPLIVSWRYSRSDSLAPPERMWVLLISLATAFAMLKWVEQPFRKPSASRAPTTRLRERAALPGLFAAVISLVVIGASMWSQEGWAWRFSGTIVAEEMKFRPDEFRAYVMKAFEEIESPFSQDDKPKMLIVGDSMAADFTNIAFSADLDEEFEIRSVQIRGGCQSILPVTPEEYARHGMKSSCAERNREAAADSNWHEADVVVIAFLWNDVILELLQRQMAQLRGLAPKAAFVLVGPKAQEISGIDLLNRLARDESAPKLNEYRTVFPDLQRLVLSQLRKKADEMGANVFDVSSLFCAATKCLRFNEFGNMLVYDNMHLTPKGAEFVGRQLRSRIDEYPYFKVRVSDS